jgi:hypothetical protein
LAFFYIADPGPSITLSASAITTSAYAIFISGEKILKREQEKENTRMEKDEIGTIKGKFKL